MRVLSFAVYQSGAEVIFASLECKREYIYINQDNNTQKILQSSELKDLFNEWVVVAHFSFY